MFKFLYAVVHIWWGNCKPLCFHNKMNISPTQSKKWGSKQKSQMFLTINIVFMGRRFLISITLTCPCTLQAQLQYVKLNTQMPFYLRWPFSSIFVNQALWFNRWIIIHIKFQGSIILMKEKSVTFKSGLYDSMEMTTETSSMWAVLLFIIFKNWGEDFQIPNWTMLFGIKIVYSY